MADPSTPAGAESAHDTATVVADPDSRGAIPPTAAKPRAARARGVVAWVLVVLIGVLTPVAVVAFWGQRTLTDAERYIETVGPLAAEEAIQQAIVTRTTDTLMTTLEENDTVSQVLDALPPQAAQALQAPIEGALEGLVTQVTTRVVESEQFQELWIGVNERLQQAIIKALSGSPDGPVSQRDDQLVLSTAAVAEAAKQELVDRGVTPLANVQIPDSIDQDIVLLRGEELKQARLIYSLTVPLTRFLIPALALLMVAAVLISTRRARVVMGLGIAVVVSMTVLSIGLSIAQDTLDSAAPTTIAQRALNAFWITLTRFLDTSVATWITGGVILALLGWFGGRSAPATAVRSALSGQLRNVGARWGSAPAFFASHWRATFIGIAVATLAITLVFDPVTMGTIIVMTLLALALCALVYVLAQAADTQKQGQEPSAVAATNS